MKILVTGATGNLGSKVVESLIETVPANNIVVSIRNAEKAEWFQSRGIEVRYGDFDKSETLKSAFAGLIASSLFLPLVITKQS
ncbi:uncharacterized protein YbjT (DUF2867 family) [Paenibacillus sp. RC21]